MTDEERAAIAFDMVLTGLIKLEMLNKNSQVRARMLINSCIDDYEHSPSKPNDDIIEQIFRLTLGLLHE